MEMVPQTQAPGDTSWHAVDSATGPAQTHHTVVVKNGDRCGWSRLVAYWVHWRPQWRWHCLHKRRKILYTHARARAHAHTHTHTFNGSFSGSTQVSRYQKGKTNLHFNDARDSEWQWHQLGHVQVWTLLQTDNYASAPLLNFLQAGCPSCHPTNSVKALKAQALKAQRRKTVEAFLLFFCWFSAKPGIVGLSFFFADYLSMRYTHHAEIFKMASHFAQG